MTAQLTMGPILFHWPAEKKRDFYFRIADEALVESEYNLYQGNAVRCTVEVEPMGGKWHDKYNGSKF